MKIFLIFILVATASCSKKEATTSMAELASPPTNKSSCGEKEESAQALKEGANPLSGGGTPCQGK